MIQFLPSVDVTAGLDNRADVELRFSDEIVSTQSVTIQNQNLEFSFRNFDRETQHLLPHRIRRSVTDRRLFLVSAVADDDVGIAFRKPDVGLRKVFRFDNFDDQNSDGVRHFEIDRRHFVGQKDRQSIGVDEVIGDGVIDRRFEEAVQTGKVKNLGRTSEVKFQCWRFQEKYLLTRTYMKRLG